MFRIDHSFQTVKRIQCNPIEGKENIQWLIEQVFIPWGIEIQTFDTHHNEAMRRKMWTK